VHEVQLLAFAREYRRLVWALEDGAYLQVMDEKVEVERGNTRVFDGAMA
jgi:hypothetical protein